MLAISIIYTACDKDTSLTEERIQIDNTEQKILNFKSKLESGNKSGEVLDIDSAVWYIEAALNYTYCEIDTSDVINIDSSFYQILDIENNRINFSEIVCIYNEFVNYLTTTINNTVGTNKKMLVTDIEFIENENINNSGNLKLTTIITGNPEGEVSFNFGETDFWHPVEGDGKCFIYEGQYIGKDASTRLELFINKSIYKPYGQYSYATDLIITTGSSSNYYWSGYRDDCLNPEDMNYWLQKGKDFAYLLNISIPDHSIINHDYFWYYYGSNDFYSHKDEMTFGIWRDARTIHE